MSHIQPCPFSLPSAHLSARTSAPLAASQVQTASPVPVCVSHRPLPPAKTLAPGEARAALAGSDCLQQEDSGFRCQGTLGKIFPNAHTHTRTAKNLPG